MKFTIITVTKNPGESLVKTVQSVLSQRYQDWELIIKDGCSSDGTLQHVPTDDRIQLIVEPDCGIYSAMNQALVHANGDVINFLNAADCYSDNHVLEQIAEILKKSNADVVWGDLRTTPNRLILRQPSKVSRFFLYRNNICHQTQFIKRSIFKRIGNFDESFQLLADIDFFLRLYKQNYFKLVHAGKILVDYDVGGCAMSPSYAHIADKELKLLHSRYFSMAERIVFGMLQILSMRKVRIRISRSRNCTPLQKLYTTFRNIIASRF